MTGPKCTAAAFARRPRVPHDAATGMQSEIEYDAIVVGAGAGGLTAACVAAAEGLKTLLVEKSPLVGGTTAVSGGMVWIPANPKMAAAGVEDSVDNEIGRAHV